MRVWKFLSVIDSAAVNVTCLCECRVGSAAVNDTCLCECRVGSAAVSDTCLCECRVGSAAVNVTCLCECRVGSFCLICLHLMLKWWAIYTRQWSLQYHLDQSETYWTVLYALNNVLLLLSWMVKMNCFDVVVTLSEMYLCVYLRVLHGQRPFAIYEIVVWWTVNVHCLHKEV